jgi:hypothetical protein
MSRAEDQFPPVEATNLPRVRRPRRDPDAAPATAPAAPGNPAGVQDRPITNPAAAAPPPAAPAAVPPPTVVPAPAQPPADRAPRVHRLDGNGMDPAIRQMWRSLLRSHAGKVAAAYRDAATAEDAWDAVVLRARADQVPAHMITAALNDVGLPENLALPLDTDDDPQAGQPAHA